MVENVWNHSSLAKERRQKVPNEHHLRNPVNCFDRHSSKDTEVANKYIKEETASVIRSMQGKVTLKYHFVHLGMAFIKRKTATKCWKEEGGNGRLFTQLVGK